MNEELHKKYQILKTNNKAKMKALEWEKNDLFTECIRLLCEYSMYSLEESEILFSKLETIFPMTIYGQIDWNKIKEYVVLNDIMDINHIVNVHNDYYILWDQHTIPVVCCELKTILQNIDNVLAVSFNTWLLSKDTKEVIEFYHEGKITYGKIID